MDIWKPLGTRKLALYDATATVAETMAILCENCEGLGRAGMEDAGSGGFGRHVAEEGDR
jgi:hypothetical protein